MRVQLVPALVEYSRLKLLLVPILFQVTARVGVPTLVIAASQPVPTVPVLTAK